MTNSITNSGFGRKAELANNYLLIESVASDGETKSYVIQVGQVDDQQDRAGYAIELLDYAGIGEPPFVGTITINQKSHSQLSYSGAVRAKIIDKRGFEEIVLKCILDTAKAVIKDKQEHSAFSLPYKNNEQRSVLLNYLLKNTQTVLALV